MTTKKSFAEIFPALPDDINSTDLDLCRIPRHIAVIMDGNGRWAKARALGRVRGHKAGIEAVRETIRTANDLGVEYLTIYSFSTENWNRPQEEVDSLMDLFARTMLAEVDALDKEDVRVMTIGDLGRLPQETKEAFESAWEQTRNNTGMTLVVAVNYGARDEILRAVQMCVDEAVAQAKAGGEGAAPAARGLLEAGGEPEARKPLEAVDFVKHLYTAQIPDPELIIRTSGELRLSNFLLWQAAYSEFVSTSVLWPDFDRYELLRCLIEFQRRDRRFGGV
jgi:undecaprenyl diphosphate synthase